MEKIYILCVEDQREVLNAILQDLAPLEPAFFLEGCESAPEAEELIEEIDARGDFIGMLVCDHVMPEKSGVDFLIEVNRDQRFKNTRKLLLTGLATHQDTINAINNADIDRYIEKPWNAELLVRLVKQLLTGYILDQGLPYEKYLPYLDTQILFERIRK
ncbi:MAG: response regulator [Saprospirales bacterium]|nr:response regulator [Saprospirales bacterium]